MTTDKIRYYKKIIIILGLTGCTLLLFQSVNLFFMAMVSSFETISIDQLALVLTGLFFLTTALSGYFFSSRLQKGMPPAWKGLLIISILAVIGTAFMIVITHVIYYNLVVIIVFGLIIFLILKSGQSAGMPHGSVV